jgi:carbon-monoxide dehydrogenase large subunit/6-hydroxypseudooxynicotine dehydrogenase subunit gamma
MGSFGSRATALAGPAVMKGAEALRGRLLALASEELEAAAEDLIVDGDRVVVRGSPGAEVSLAKLAELSRPPTSLPRETKPGLEEEAYFHCADMSFPYGLHCVAVEVDTDTGGIEIKRYAIAYDVGVAINPQLVEGQVLGGAAQGIGGALLEEFAYDETGQIVSASFIDYLIPTALEVPPVDVLITEDAPTPLTPLGAKGAGEGGTSAAGGALANAVSDALGTEALTLPLTPEWVSGQARRAAAG